jgi:glucose-1-phosphate adenylyltransferase
MDYAKMLKFHAEMGADATVATIEMAPEQAARQFGIVVTDENSRIVEFQEKPAEPARSRFNPSKVNASMGVYIFNTQLLIPILIADAEDPNSSHDFGKDILPKILGKYRLYTYNFIDENRKEALYWRDVGTIDAYFDANMDLVAVNPEFNVYDSNWPLRTKLQQYPPAKFVFADEQRMGVTLDSIVCPGCIVSGGRVRNSVLGYDVRVNSFCEVDRSIVYNHVNIGRHSRIRNAIIDRHVSLPERTVIGYDLDEDRKRYHVTDRGIVVVVREESMLEEPE